MVQRANSDRNLAASHSDGFEDARRARGGRRLSFNADASPRVGGVLRRGSRDFTSWLARLVGPSSDKPGSRPGSAKRNARLEGELRKYADPLALPRNVRSVRPDGAAGAGAAYASSGGDGAADGDAVRWTARVRYDDACPDAPMRLLVPSAYPFKGPTAFFRDREVRFVMGRGDLEGNFEPYVLHAPWTPAQSIADAVAAAMEEVRKAEQQDASPVKPM